LGIGNEGNSISLGQSFSTVSCLDEDISFTPGSMFQFNDVDIITPFQTVPVLSDQNKSRRIVALTPSKFCPKSIGTPQRIPVDNIRNLSEDNVIKNLGSSFDNPSVSLEDSHQSQKEEQQTSEDNPEDPPSSVIECTPFKVQKDKLSQLSEIECTPFKGPRQNTANKEPPQTPSIKVQSTSEEEVNPVEYLRSKYPAMTAEDIVQICKSIKPEDQLENIDAIQFQDIDTSIFERVDDEQTENSLRRYSFVKFTKSSLSVQLKTVQRYGHYYGSSVVPKNQHDPTPVRRSKRLESKTPQTASKKSIGRFVV